MPRVGFWVEGEEARAFFATPEPAPAPDPWGGRPGARRDRGSDPRGGAAAARVSGAGVGAGGGCPPLRGGPGPLEGRDRALPVLPNLRLARSFAVADVYDALTSDRPYRQAWPRARAVRHLGENAGRLYDPEVVEAFLGLPDGEPLG